MFEIISLVIKTLTSLMKIVSSRCRNIEFTKTFLPLLNQSQVFTTQWAALHGGSK